jgi:hypothetical protein
MALRDQLRSLLDDRRQQQRHPLARVQLLKSLELGLASPVQGLLTNVT